jgi:uncharacterized protein YoxC
MVMELLLLIAIIAVAASALYVAATVKSRIVQNIDLLINNAAESTRREINAPKGGLGQQIQAITEELPQDRELLLKHIQATSGGLTQQIQAITGELRQDSELVRHLDEQIDTRQSQLTRDLQELGHRVAQLQESVDRQSTRVAAIYRHTKRQEMQTESSSEIDSLILAMLEAEFHVESQGWGKPPRLYALTEKTSSIDGHHELRAEMRGAGPEALIPVEQEPLPDGNLIEVLAGTHWPEDVVGCVLVTELTDLPPQDGEGAYADPPGAEQWASTHPDGRPARLAVGVRRNGEHTCGLRIKGEDDVQIRAELAQDLVTALLRTF